MKKKSDMFVREDRDKKTRNQKRRNVAAAVGLSFTCIVGMAGIYYTERGKAEPEEPLVNWEDNATSDLSERVKVHLSEETEAPRESEGEVIANSDGDGVLVGDDSLLREPQATAVSPLPTATEEASGTVVGGDALNAAGEEQTQTTSAGSAQALNFGVEDKLSWPVEGSIILDYSMDATTYFPTLEQYKYNPAILIQSQVGTEVRAAAEGVVASIVESEETGITVTMDIGDGYQLVYGQLANVSYGTGARLDKGDVVGTVAEPTKYYSVEGSNLFFEMLSNGAPVNPTDYLKEGTITE